MRDESSDGFRAGNRSYWISCITTALYNTTSTTPSPSSSINLRQIWKLKISGPDPTPNTTTSFVARPSASCHHDQLRGTVVSRQTRTSTGTSSPPPSPLNNTPSNAGRMTSRSRKKFVLPDSVLSRNVFLALCRCCSGAEYGGRLFESTLSAR